MTRLELARIGVAGAMRTRMKAGVPVAAPLRVNDFAEAMGLDVRFVDVDSLEGMYVGPNEATVLVSALRPRGRQAFTCAHEVGHHVLGHGVTIDELANSQSRRFDAREFSADCFAGALLMPRAALRAVLRGLDLRETDCQPTDLYRVSCWFGVGYGTLVHHLWRSLEIIDTGRAKELLKSPVSEIKGMILGHKVKSHVVPVNALWDEHSVDVELGDYIVCEKAAGNHGGVLVRERDCDAVVFKATRVGRGELVGAGWRSEVRVSRSGFVGRYRYKYVPEADS